MSADDRIGDSIKLLFSAYKNIRWNDIPMLDSSTDSKEKDGTGDISEGSEETEDSFSEQKVKEITIQYLNRFYHGTYGPTSTTIHNRHLVFDAVYESSNYDAVFEIKYYKNKDTIKVEDIQNILDRSSYLVNQSRKKIVIFLILVFDKESEKINVEKQVSKLNSMYSDILKIRTLSIEEINNKSI